MWWRRRTGTGPTDSYWKLKLHSKSQTLRTGFLPVRGNTKELLFQDRKGENAVLTGLGIEELVSLHTPLAIDTELQICDSQAVLLWKANDQPAAHVPDGYVRG
jgi:hypothetical protein